MIRRGLTAGTLALAALVAPAGDDPKGQPEKVAIPGIENAFRLTPRLYSGSQPEGPESFEALRKLGIKTILSVDGSEPDVETAKRYGLRYVHLPIGYDGVPRAQAIRIAKAVRTLPGPVFLHCHHGKHRGPAAASACVMASDGWDRDRATAWMKAAGTSPDYAGLYASIRAFTPPTEEEWARAGETFPERVDAPAIVDLMVTLDGRWDKVKAAKAAGLKPKDDQLVQELVQVRELFRELGRLPDVEKKGPDFAAKVKAAEDAVTAFEAALKSLNADVKDDDRKKADSAFAAVGKACTGCHVQHRD